LACRGGAQGRNEVLSAWQRPPVVGGQIAYCEADQALLVLVVHPLEFTTVDDVLVVAGDAPRSLTLPGVGAGAQCREPGLQLRMRQALEIGIAVDFTVDSSSRFLAEGHGAVVLPAGFLGEAVDVSAIVRMPGDVEQVSGGVHGVGISVAVFYPACF